MPDLRSPGVYISESPLVDPPEELGASSAVAVIVGAASKGPIDAPTRLESWNDYVTVFGGFSSLVGVDETDASQPTAAYVRATAAGGTSTALDGVVGAKKGDLGFVNPYRGTKATFYKYDTDDSAEDGFEDPHSIYVFNGTIWVDTGWTYNSASPLFRDRTDIIGGTSPAVNIVFVEDDPTSVAPTGFTPAYGDLAIRWDADTDQLLFYVRGDNDSTYFDGSGLTEESNTVTLANSTGGTFTITYEGQTTSGIAWNASAAVVKTALEALSNVAPGDVLVARSGSSGAYVYTITATDTGAFADTNVTVTASAASLTGIAATATVTTTTAASTGVAQVVSVVVANATAGDFVLTFDGFDATIPWNASAATVTSLVNAAAGSTVISTTRTGADGAQTYVITSVALDDVAAVTTNVSGLTGIAATATVGTTQAGGASAASNQGIYDPTHAAEDTQIALPAAWNPLNATTQGSGSGLDSKFSTDSGVADRWGPFEEADAYSAFLDLTDISGFAEDTWEPTFPSTASTTQITALSYLPYAVYNFFQNGGRTCWVVRSIDHSRAGEYATFNYKDNPDSLDQATAFDIVARGAGTWGNKVGVLITTQVTNSAVTAYTVRVYWNSGTVASPSWAEVERFTNLSMFGDIPGLRRFDISLNDGLSGSKYIQVANFTPSPNTENSASALLADSDTAAVNALGQGSGNTAGSDPGIPQSSDLLLSAIQGVPKVEGPILVNAAGLTTDIADPTAFRSIMLTSSQFGDRTDIVCINDGFTPRGNLPSSNYSANLIAAANSTSRTDSRVAVFAPWVVVPDPAVQGGTILIPPGGVVLGTMSRMDASAGVFRATAGLEASTNALGVEAKFTKSEQGALNAQHVNILRPVAGGGICIMGARSRKFYGADMYLSNRRTLIYIERALENATQFAVFANNDETLWARLQLTADRVLRPLWEQRGLKGETADKAYYIKCDSTINTPAVIASGEVRLEIGVALQYPAEFVVIRISQFDAGASNTEVQPV